MAAMADATKEKQIFTFRSFLSGASAVVLVYAALGGWLWMQRDQTQAKIAALMPSQTAVISRPQILPPPEAEKHEAQIHEEAPVEAPVVPVEETVQHTEETPLETTPETTHTDVPTAVETVTHEPIEETPTPPLAPQEAKPLPTFAAESLAPPVTEGLYEETPEKLKLPMVRKSDRFTVFEASRKPFDETIVTTSAPRIAVAVMGIGLSAKATDEALSVLPSAVSVVLSPYSSDPHTLVEAARKKGHEVWMTLPVEGETFPMQDNGAASLLIGAPAKDNMMKLYNLMNLAQGIVGFVSSPRPAFVHSVQDSRPIVGEIFRRGMAFVDTSPNPAALPRDAAESSKSPYAAVDFVFDGDLSESVMRERLAKLEELAKNRGYASVLIAADAATYPLLLDWWTGLAQKEIATVPLSALAKK
jgi:polysaccharide deacetylase 2 family uncharacterized protein YibQ